MTFINQSSAETVAVASMRAMLIQAQSLDIMIGSLAPALGRSQIGGEMCEVIEEIANVYLDLSERIAAARAIPIRANDSTPSHIADCA
jgi:hypothetical protein